MSQFITTALCTQVGYLSQNVIRQRKLQALACQVDLTIGRPPIQMAEIIWPPGIFFQYAWTCKVSASYLLYIQSSINEIKNCNLYIYKIGAFFDLGNRTPPRPLALEG